MFPAFLNYQGILATATACANFRTPSVVQRHLTAISLTPGHASVCHLGFRPPLTAVICYLNRACICLLQCFLPFTPQPSFGKPLVRFFHLRPSIMISRPARSVKLPCIIKMLSVRITVVDVSFVAPDFSIGICLQKSLPV